MGLLTGLTGASQPGTSPGNTKGATAAQNQILSSQQDFMKTLQQDFGTTFAGQQNILHSLTKSLTNTLNAGPGQFGFSTPETTALNTMATTTSSQEYQNVKRAAGEAAAASGGGANLPTGSQNAVNAEIAEKSGENLSNKLLGIQEAGYKQGVENYNEAVSGLTSAASIENPTAYAGQASQAGEAAFGSATQIQKENAAANPYSQIGGLVGSLAGAALSAAVPGAGAALSGVGSALYKSGGAGQGAYGPIQTIGTDSGITGLDSGLSTTSNFPL